MTVIDTLSPVSIAAMFEFDTEFDYNDNDQTYSTTRSLGRNGPGRDDSDSERQNGNWDRDNLRHIAHSTLQILDYEEYFPPGRDGPYDLRAKNSVDG